MAKIFPGEYRVLERRAAFDIGSGSTKLCVADVAVDSGEIVAIIYGQEMPVECTFIYYLDFNFFLNRMKLFN